MILDNMKIDGREYAIIIKTEDFCIYDVTNVEVEGSSLIFHSIIREGETFHSSAIRELAKRVLPEKQKEKVLDIINKIKDTRQ